MTIAWHNGQYIRQDHTREDIEARRNFIAAQIEKIETHCTIVPGAAPDAPSELASTLTDTFGSDVLDEAYLAAEGYVLVSEDLYYRQIATAAVGANVKSVWLQPIVAFGRETSLIDAKRHAEITVRLAWRRHAHLALDAETLWRVLHDDTSNDLADYRATSAFIGTRNADLMSHLSATLAFLGRVWLQAADADLRIMRATGILLEQLTRFRQSDWALVLALIGDMATRALREYIDQWTIGHFLGQEKLREAERELVAIRAANREAKKVGSKKRSNRRS